MVGWLSPVSSLCLCSDTGCVVLSLPGAVVIFHYEHPCPRVCVCVRAVQLMQKPLTE